MSRCQVKTTAKVLIACSLSLFSGCEPAFAQMSTAQGPQKMGPVGQDEAKPTKVVAPVNSVVDPGIIPSRQVITPAGLQSVFESRVNGVAFNEDGKLSMQPRSVRIPPYLSD